MVPFMIGVTALTKQEKATNAVSITSLTRFPYAEVILIR